MYGHVAKWFTYWVVYHDTIRLKQYYFFSFLSDLLTNVEHIEYVYSLLVQ